MKFLFWIIILLPSACGSKLRYSFCESSEIGFPDSIRGLYRFTWSGPDAARGAAQATRDIYVHFDGPMTVSMDSGSWSLLQSVSKIRLATSRNLFGKVDSILGTVCSIDGKNFYSQAVQADGTYGISRLEIGQDRFRMDALIFSPDRMDELGVPYLYFPDGLIFSEGYWRPSVNPVTIIVDNRRIQREKLLSAARVAPGGGFEFTKVELEPDRLARKGRWFRFDLVHGKLTSDVR